MGGSTKISTLVPCWGRGIWAGEVGIAEMCMHIHSVSGYSFLYIKPMNSPFFCNLGSWGSTAYVTV